MTNRITTIEEVSKNYNLADIYTHDVSGVSQTIEEWYMDYKKNPFDYDGDILTFDAWIGGSLLC